MPKQAPDTTEVRPIEVNALGITYQVQLEGGGTIAYESKLDNTCARADIDELLDRIHGATERLVAKANIAKAKQRVTMIRARIKLQEQEYVFEENKQKASWSLGKKQGNFRPSDAQRSMLDNIQKTIASGRADLPVAEYEVARLQALIDGTEPPAELTVEQLHDALGQRTRATAAEAAD